MSRVPALQRLARSVAGGPEAALQRLLTLVCEQLGMDVAFVSVLDGRGNRTVRQSAYADGTSGPAGLTEPLAATWCGRIVVEGPLLVPDLRGDAELEALPVTTAFSIVSYAGVPLYDQDGSVLGTLCALGHAPNTSLNARDADVLIGLAEVVAPFVRALDGAPLHRSVAADLAEVAAAVEGAQGVERLSRPLLEALHDLTKMASTYLTVVHEDAGIQEIRYALNSGHEFELPEGLLVPWDDTLCKRAIDEGRACTTNVPEVWGDSDAARSRGIQVYVSVPVRTSNGQLWGTLCAADSVEVAGVEAHLPTMRLFARLIAAEVEREGAPHPLTHPESDVDQVTGRASRRRAQAWLFRNLAASTPDRTVVAVYVDIDDFAAVNETLGRAAGDAVLVELGERLRACTRSEDLVARMEADEFLVAALVPRDAAAALHERVRSIATFTLAWRDATVAVRASVGRAVSDGDDGPSLVSAARAAMYRAKHPH